jgi:hypothetical protein
MWVRRVSQDAVKSCGQSAIKDLEAPHLAGEVASDLQ